MRLIALFATPSLALAFTLARPTALSATPWDADAAPPLDAATRALGAQPWTWEPLPDAEAVCLDGSQYGLVTCIGAGPIKTTYINIQGGGCESPQAVTPSSRYGCALPAAAALDGNAVGRGCVCAHVARRGVVRRGVARRGAAWRGAARRLAAQ
jgi:hypothetical protein